MAKQRIEYIDAMRGFTMILVVYSHICSLCLGDMWMGWNNVFFLFRLPCFFFISGWLFEKTDRQWNYVSIKATVHHKFMVQIVPTFLFLLLLAPPPEFFSRLGATKGGYWFTFTLFEFFMLTIFAEKYLKKWGGVFALFISATAFCYDIYYNRYFNNLGLLTDIIGFLSFMTWRYFLFFYVGTWMKRHFDGYIRWSSKPLVIIGTFLGFLIIALLPHSDNAISEYLIFAVGGILGLTIVFNFFRIFSRFFVRKRWLGRSLQYIGIRTLDIYLLHYFLLPKFLVLYRDQLQTYDSRVLEFLVAMSLALIVVVLCLLVSYLIRLNHFLGHFLFGVDYHKNE
jgi:fucose 4-O-acetylase-like acetyltransferase